MDIFCAHFFIHEVHMLHPTCFINIKYDIFTDEISAVPRHDSKESLSSDHGVKDMDIEDQWLSQVSNKNCGPMHSM